MNPKRLNRWPSAVAASACVAVLVTLTACGGGGGPIPPAGAPVLPVAPAPVSVTLGGTAAVGAPIVGGIIATTCAGGGAVPTTTTNGSGAWSVTLTDPVFPCAVQVSGGNITGASAYHSIASAAGTLNITPITDLIVANLARSATPTSWFSGLAPATLAAIQVAAIDSALNQVRTALALPALNNINPLTAGFSPVGGNPLDDVLSAFRAAMTNTGVAYATLLAQANAATFTVPTGFSAALGTGYGCTASGGGCPVPAAPTAVSAAVISNSQINLSWGAVSGATGYNVYRSTTAGVALTAANRIVGAPVTVTTFASNGLSASTLYYYKVTAVNAAGESLGSTEVSATTSATVSAPTAPASITATSVSATSINVGWAAVAGASGYNVYRATAPGVAIAAANKVNSLPVADTGYGDAGLNPATTYYYKITAVNGAGESAASAEGSAATGAAPLPGTGAMTISSVRRAVGLTGNPVTGLVSEVLTINGSGFVPNAMTATFGGNVTGYINFLGGTSIQVRIPPGAVSGPITLKNTATLDTVSTAAITVQTPACAGVPMPPVTGALGINWTNCAGNYPNDIGNGQLVWDGTQFINNLGSSSLDGYTWTAQTATDKFESIGVLGNTAVATVGNGSTGTRPEVLVANYATGFAPGAWRAATLPTVTNPYTVTGVRVVNSRFWVSTNAGYVFMSVDGQTWTTTSYLPDVWTGTKYLQWCGIGFAQTPSVCSSVDGQTSTSATLIDTAAPARSNTLTFIPANVVSDGTKYVAVFQGAVWTSTDGTAWTLRASNSASGLSNAVNPAFSSVIWTGSQFLGVTTRSGTTIPSQFVTSPDGITWTNRQVNSTGFLSGLAYSPTLNRAVAAGQGQTNGVTNNLRAMLISP